MATAAAIWAFGAGAAQAATFTVNDAGDGIDADGCSVSQCTLREAILAANLLPDADTIAFDLPTIGGVARITPSTPLPPVVADVRIDASTQAGYFDSEVPRVALGGETAATGDGLRILAGNVTVRALAIGNWTAGAGIAIGGNAHARVLSSFIGASVTDGLAVEPNGTGIDITGGSADVGDTNRGESLGNVITGNTGVGVSARNSTLVMRSNAVGRRVTSEFVDYPGNGGDGVQLRDTAATFGTEPNPDNTALNVISGNGGNGISVFDGSTVAIRDDHVGLDRSSGLIGNDGDGVSVQVTDPARAAVVEIGAVDLGGAQIAGNRGRGLSADSRAYVRVFDSSGIHDNGGLGIVRSDGPGKPPTPTLRSVNAIDPAADVAFSWEPNRTAHLTFRRNSSCDPSGFGEGGDLLGTADVPVGPSGQYEGRAGNISFPPGEYVTVTATETESGHAANGTSEFSNCVRVSGPRADLALSASNPSTAQTGVGLTTLWTVANVGTGTGSSNLRVTYSRPVQFSAVPSNCFPLGASGLVCTVDNVPAGGSVTMPIRTHFATSGEVTASGSIDDRPEDDNSANNRATSAFTVTGPNCTAVGTPGNDTLTTPASASARVCGMAGADTLTANGGTLVGGDGNDTLRGTARNETFRGADGTDTVDYSAAAAAINGNLQSGAFTGQGSDTVNGVEIVVGSPFADRIQGGAQDEQLRGLAGNDTLSGLGGADTLVGGAGNDTLSGGAGNDTARGEAGNDTLNGDAGVDLLDGGAGTNVFDGGAGSPDRCIGAGSKVRCEATS